MTAQADTFVFRVEGPDPRLPRARPGDCLIVAPDHPRHPVRLISHHDFNPALLVDLAAQGVLTLYRQGDEDPAITLRRLEQRARAPALPAAYHEIARERDTVVREPMGIDLLERDSPSYRRLIATRDRLDRTWPILCRDCGREFRPNRRKIVRCPACRNGGR